jgi:hypothetical protein
MRAAIMGKNVHEARELLQAMIGDRFTIAPGQSAGRPDEYELLNDILESVVQIAPGRFFSINEIISRDYVYQENGAVEAMERNGVALVFGTGPRPLSSPRGFRGLFFNLRLIQRSLLKIGTRWTLGMDLETMLLRLAGATRQQRTMYQRRFYGIQIPASVIMPVLEELTEEGKPEDVQLGE